MWGLSVQAKFSDLVAALKDRVILPTPAAPAAAPGAAEGKAGGEKKKERKKSHRSSKSRGSDPNDPVQKMLKGTRFLSEYDLGKVLGTGAYSVVRRCTHIGTGAEFAVKVIRKKYLPPADWEHLKTEVNIMQQVT